MKIKSILLAFSVFSMVSASAQTKPAAAAKSTGIPRPKLVVGIVVDQMRWDYLYRYYDRYQAGGFKRMINEGFTAENTYIDYIPTVTAVGHSTIYTGSTPAISGMAGNDFIIQATGKTMYCTADSTVSTVGSTSHEGEMSPRNLLVSTITDELRLATNFRSKVIGVALKDRGSILPAGHLANASYWFDDPTGNWITSTYYTKELPTWVTKFNDQKLARKYLDTDWNTLYPISTYVQSSADNNKYEGKYPGAATPTFPVKTSGMQGVAIIQSTPYGNSFTLDMAKAIVDNEQMGKSGVTDFLAVSLSSTDYVGHLTGPNSIETEDTYLRLDKDLASFFTYLDGKLGAGNYTVFLSADHGAAHNVNFLLDNNIPTGLWQGSAQMRDLNAMLNAKYKVDKLVLSFSNYQISLNNVAIAANKLDDAAIRKDVVNFMKDKPGIANVVDLKDLANANVTEQMKMRMINGYNPFRSGVIQIFLQPGWYSGGATGTTHGSWEAYDTHIPLVFMGWGVKHGKINRPTHMTDIAPTLAALLHIQEPDGNIGQPISEVIK
jgi:predicted AlkP superfamily pyrophosphatase or phosphodiesterase